MLLGKKHLVAPPLVATHFVVGLLLLLTPVFAAPPPSPALGTRLGIDRVPGLTILSSSGDDTEASYTVGSPQNVQTAANVVEAHLLGTGWTGHPNVTEPPAPKPGVTQQLRSFVQGSELLTLLASQTEREAVTLQFTLVALGAPPQVAAAP